MHKKFHPTMSVERMSAWFDGNLSTHDMLETAAQIQGDLMLEDVVAMSDAIDSDIESFVASGEPLPEELRDNDFDLPNPDREASFFGGRLLGQACCANFAPAPAAKCDFDMAADAAPDDDNDEKSLFDKIKDMFSREDED